MNGLESALAPALTWLAAHPAWAGVAIGLIAFTESLALVGLLVPGAVLMFMAGAVVGGSQLDILPMLAWAIAGAILGDGVSYALGRYYRDQLRTLPVIRRYPGALARAERLFQRHGGKSVVIGRFVGPVRPVIPAVVGMLGMPPGRFFLANVSSALVWGPAYLLPGVVFGASLMLALEVMGRLMAWLVVLFGGFFVLHAVLRALRHRRGWLWWLSLLVVLASLWAASQSLLPWGWERGWIALADAQRSAGLQALAWRITQLGGVLPIALATAVLAGGLWRAQQPRRALAALLGVGLSIGLANGLKPVFNLPRPNDLSQTAAFAAAFPSAHAAAISALVTAWLSCGPGSVSRQPRWAGLWLGLGVALVVLVASSRGVLGVHWPSDILAGVALGVVLGALPGLIGVAASGAFSRPRENARVVAASIMALGLTAGVTQTLHWPDPRAAYPEQAVIGSWPDQGTGLSAAAWADQRLSLTGPHEAFSAYWLAGDAKPAGFGRWWRPAVAWRWQTALRWLSPQPSPSRLPVLPRYHQGRLPAVVWVKIDPVQRSRWVLRAWREAHTPTGSAWLLSLEHERIRSGVLLPRFNRRQALAGEVAALVRAPAVRAGLERRDGAIPLFAPRRNERLVDTQAIKNARDDKINHVANAGGAMIKAGVSRQHDHAHAAEGEHVLKVNR